MMEMSFSGADSRQGTYRLLTLGLFLLVCGALIVGSDFLPFGTDNNETFSSFLHARNMYQWGLFSFGGLTNETTSWEPAAQAYIYTHQGNFPRIYSYILYLFGARSVESQIVLTTGTVGLAGIVMAYKFMERRVDALFAFLFCAVLCTDYLMSLQWLVNTWRVWQLLLFFAPLLLADRLAARGFDPLALLALAIVFMANFYCEIIFAFFVAFVFSAYLALHAWRRPGLVLTGWVAGGIGAVLAIAILAAQIAWAIGWDGFVKDLTLTFFSRNNLPAGKLAEYQNEVIRFARDNNIVFWDNFNAFRGPFQDPRYTIKILFRYTFLQMTAPIMMLCFIMAMGVSMRGVITSGMRWFPASWFCNTVSPAVAQACILPAFAFFAAFVIVGSRALGVGGYEFYLTVDGTTTPFVLVMVAASSIITLYVQRDGAQADKIGVTVVLVAAATYVLIVVAQYNASLPAAWMLLVVVGAASWFLYERLSRLSLDWARVLGVVAVLVSCGVLARLVAGLFLSENATGGVVNYDVLTLKFIERLGGHTAWKAIVLMTGLLAALWVIEPPAKAKLGGLVIYVMAGVVGFLLVATLSFGYIITAYFSRNCPFILYFTALFPALLVYALIRTLPDRVTDWNFGLAKGVLAAPVLAAALFTWFVAQDLYLKAIPPGRMTPMFRELARLGGSSVSNTYATPIAIKTGDWSYFDPVFFFDGSWLDHDRIEMSRRDWRYLWFADHSNPAYLKPKYFVCWMHLNFKDTVAPPPPCGAYAGIREIRAGKGPFKNVEVAKDDKRDLWSIVELDWSGSKIAITEGLQVRSNKGQNQR
jgi:hypothetical protein